MVFYYPERSIIMNEFKKRSFIPMKVAKNGYIAVSVLLAALGILLVAKPTFSVNAIGVICGILLSVFGVIKLVGYFSNDPYRLAFQYDMPFGIMLIVLGIIMLVNPGKLVNFICIVLGLWVLISSLFNIQTSLEAKKFGISQWWIVFVLSVIAAVWGLVLVFRPSEAADVMAVILGFTLIFESAVNICTVLTSVKIVNNRQPDIYAEEEYYYDSNDEE